MKALGTACAGYLVLFVVLFTTLTAMYFGLGSERTFLPGSYAVTPLWIAVFCFFQFDAGLVAGVVVSKLSRDRQVPFVLAAMTMGLGIVMALPAVLGTVPDAGPRIGSLTNMDAMMQAQTPVWIQLIAPALAALGVTVGSMLRSLAGRRRP
ncbi:MAG: hypothetical protein P3B76_13830 [Gemmatimonadota bacterium]|nr:hypothetical protein [Gemmatimonadota bacterium]MDQ8168380.1 hypothetical protein [Gemmatimonadota bacterium]MDQ8173755.1 hypothetical protein [Gemmatimonadota bacterium]